MKKLNVKLPVGVAALALLLGLGTLALHSFQSGRIARALLWQAQHAEEEGRPDQAAKFLARYLELEPGANEERAHLGRILADEQTATTPRARQRALFILEQVVTREPERQDSRRLLVRMAFELRRYQSALEHLLVLQKTAPKDGEVLELLGRTHQAMGKPEEAKDYYQKAIDADIHMVGAYERLALLLRRHPDPASREHRRDPDTIMDRLVANNERSVAARLARWNYFAESGLLNPVASLLTSPPAAGENDLSRLDAPTRAKLEKAGQDLVRALELAPDDLDVLLAGSEWERARGRLDGARAHLRRGQQLHPEDPRLYRHRAALDLQDGKPVEALGCLREGTKAVSGRAQAALRWTLANVLLDQGQPGDARKELERLEKGGSSRPALDYLNARLIASDGKWAQAARLFERARAALEALPAPDRDTELFLAQTDLLLGRCYDQLNDSERKMAAYDRVAAR